MAFNLKKLDTLLFFGSFDPFTIGHAHVVDMALRFLKPKLGVVIIPAWKAVWEKQLSSFEQRVSMIQLAIEKHPSWKGKVVGSRLEEQLQFSGRTIEPLTWYATQYPAEHFGLVMGSDSLLSLTRWYEWRQILKLAPIFAVARGHETIAHLEEVIDPQLQEFLGKRIFFLPNGEETPSQHASSTQARAEVRVKGVTLQVEPEVLEYIKTQRLYL